MIITSNEKYILRTWEVSDASSLAKHINNKKIWDNVRDVLPYPYTLEDAHSFIKHVLENAPLAEFCIEVDGEAIGAVGFVKNTDVGRFSAEVGYWIGEKYWNHGIVTDVLKNAIEYYFNNSDVVLLIAPVYEFNRASARVLEKIGFTFKCSLTKAAFKNGKFTNMLLYEMVKQK